MAEEPEGIDPDEMEEVEVVMLDDPEQFVHFVKTKSSDPFAKAEIPRENLQPAVKRKATRLEKKYEGQADTGSKQIEEEFFSSYSFFDVVEPPHNLDSLAKLYEISTAHASAVRAKVTNIVGLGYEFRETALTKFSLRELYEDEDALSEARKNIVLLRIALRKWAESTNKEDTFTETMKKVWTDVETMGNGYLEIGRKRNNEIGYIGHIPAQTMRVRRKRDGYVQIKGASVTYFRKFGEKNENPITNDPLPNEIIHFKKYTPTNSYYGVPDILPAIENIGGNKFATDYNNEYFQNKAVPRYLITTKNARLSPEAERKLLQFFQATVKGQSHRSVYIPFSEMRSGEKAELKIEPIEVEIQDASFVNFFRLNDDQIFMAHRVPKSKVVLADDASLAASRDADKNFKEQVCRPEQDLIEQRLGAIFEIKTDALYFALNEMTLTDADTQSKIHERQLKTMQKTPNEVRAEMDMIGYPGGDEVLPVFTADGQEAAEVRNELTGDERDSERSANAADTDGEGRNTQGEGRAAE
jgi:PBSX family phage portal protein